MKKELVLITIVAIAAVSGIMAISKSQVAKRVADIKAILTTEPTEEALKRELAKVKLPDKEKRDLEAFLTGLQGTVKTSEIPAMETAATPEAPVIGEPITPVAPELTEEKISDLLLKANDLTRAQQNLLNDFIATDKQITEFAPILRKNETLWKKLDKDALEVITYNIIWRRAYDKAQLKKIFFTELKKLTDALAKVVPEIIVPEESVAPAPAPAAPTKLTSPELSAIKERVHTIGLKQAQLNELAAYGSADELDWPLIATKISSPEYKEFLVTKDGLEAIIFKILSHYYTGSAGEETIKTKLPEIIKDLKTTHPTWGK